MSAVGIEKANINEERPGMAIFFKKTTATHCDYIVPLVWICLKRLFKKTFLHYFKIFFYQISTPLLSPPKTSISTSSTKAETCSRRWNLTIGESEFTMRSAPYSTETRFTRSTALLHDIELQFLKLISIFVSFSGKLRTLQPMVWKLQIDWNFFIQDWN